jgi:hypothetical protein
MWTRLRSKLDCLLIFQVSFEPGAANDNNQHSSVVYEKAKRNVFKTLLTVSCCFILCWSWNEIYFFLFNLGVNTDFEGWFYHFTVIAVFSSCCLNPFIYAIRYKEFQDGIRRMLKRAFPPSGIQSGTNSRLQTGLAAMP